MKQPHSPATDAYSVGEALSEILKHATRGHDEDVCRGDDNEKLGAVKCVVFGLTCESPTARMTLEEAERNSKRVVAVSTVQGQLDDHQPSPLLLLLLPTYSKSDGAVSEW